MAKTSSINRNDKRRKMAKSAEGKRKRLKALIRNKTTPMEERFAAVLKLAEMPRNSAKVRIHNRHDQVELVREDQEYVHEHQ